MKASEGQIGGNHYAKLKIQPMQYALENGLNYAQANAIKYITRYKDKNGIEDLREAMHCIELLIEWEVQKADKAMQKAAEIAKEIVGEAVSKLNDGIQIYNHERANRIPISGQDGSGGAAIKQESDK